MKYKLNAPISEYTINQINNLPAGSTIEFKNTKGLKSNDFKKIKKDIKIRIIGGLDEVEKPKYNAENYYNRTIYTPNQISKILEKFELIESRINPKWNDLDKALFVYKTLVDNMEYDYKEQYGDTDYNRNLCGIIYGMSVCAGFSMIYKELMDRNNIECLYQNKQHSHAWNVIKINDVYYPIDLTWDVTNKSNEKKCNFYYFANDPHFFENSHHKGTNELIIPSNTLPKLEIEKSLQRISNKTLLKQSATTYTNNSGKNIEYWVNEKDKYNQLFIIYDGKLKTILYDDKRYLDFLLNFDYSTNSNDCIISSKNQEFITNMRKNKANMKIITRNDSSQLYIEDLQKNEEGLHKFVVLKYNKNGQFYISNILSEEKLTSKNMEPSKEEFINNYLLSDNRLGEKISRFGGYVGFVRQNYGRYEKMSNTQIEEKVSGIKRF